MERFQWSKYEALFFSELEQQLFPTPHGRKRRMHFSVICGAARGHFFLRS